MVSPSAQAAVPDWRIGTGSLSLERPRVMGILNVTPDSFSDGGRFRDRQRAVDHGCRMAEEGADLIDVGGESTRPGAAPVSSEEEIERVVPVIEALQARIAVPLSVDTSKAAVAREALAVGASVVNDVTALADPEMGGVVAGTGAGLVLMHMRGAPGTMQDDPRYGDVVSEVAEHLKTRLGRAVSAGVDPERIAIDPGIGFGKTVVHNLELIRGIDVLAALGRPVLIGVSRKAFLGTLLRGMVVERRVMGTAAACVMALAGGAHIFRVHDIAPVREALTVAHAIRTGIPNPET